MTASCETQRHELNLNIHLANPLSATIYRAVKKPVETFLGFDRLRAVYRQSAQAGSGGAFLQGVLDTFDITPEIGDGDLANVPPDGPALLLSNHPFGVLDPVAVLSMVLAVRPDAMVMGNHLLWRIPEMRELLVPVNPFGGKKAARENLRSMRQALHVLKEGRLLCVFPSGTVSHFHFRRGRFSITDPCWNPIPARLATMTRATVIPAHVSGHNSILFQLGGLLHPLLRTALLPRETVRKHRPRLCIRMGSPIPSHQLQRLRSDEERIEYIRSRAYLLAEDLKTRTFFFRRKIVKTPLKPIAPAQPGNEVRDEFEKLPADQILVAHGPYRVFSATADQIPVLLREIARLRELTFRQEGEGTGNPLDTDRFDTYYRHLVLWDSKKGLIAGAYRMGLSEEIVPRFGARGFYTHSLFRFGRKFTKRMTPAIELGRSFVIAEYQKSFQPLFLLWKGLGRFVCNHPQYRYLFGPVSITRAYRGKSRQIMADFLRENCRAADLSPLVRPRKPFRNLFRKHPELKTAVDNVRDIRELSELISELEHDHKGVPVLIRQYLRLGGVVLDFNVDSDFSEVLDALVLVDLTRTPPRTLAKYMGRAASNQFLNTHQTSMAVA